MQQQLETGRVYRLRSRNLKYGVYTGSGTFIGIRTKFDNRFLFTETLDTATPLEPLGKVSTEIQLATSLGTEHWDTGELITYVDGAWRNVNTLAIVPDARPVSVPNTQLKTYLEEVERGEYEESAN